MIDFDNYLPSYNSSAAFIGTPIYDNEQKIGVIVFQLPVDRINNIMTDNGQWEKIGLGKSGETYLVGRDSLLRTQSRFLMEDKKAYLSTLEIEGYSDAAIHQINTQNNSIGIQKVTSIGVRNALAGTTGAETFNDYRGIPVLSSYRPLTVKDVNWVIMSEIDKKEAFSAIDVFVSRMIFILIFLIVLIPILAIYFSRGITNPIKKLSNISKQMALGRIGIRANLNREDEIGILAHNFDSMSDSMERLMNQLEEANSTLAKKVQIRTKEVEKAHFITQSIIDNANDAIITIDESQTIILINPAALKIFGYSKKEIIGSSLTELLPKPFRQNHHKHIDTFKHSKEKAKQMSARTQVMGKRKNGEEFYAEVSISKQKIDGKYQFTAFLKDITERKILEFQIEDANKRMENELNIGKEIQMSMLPLIFPAFPNHSEFNIFALLESAREVGGDFYDFYFIEENKFLFAIADVAGKGVPSALFMAVSKTLIKSRANEDDSPASIVTFVNDELTRDNKTSMFVTLFLCIIDLSTGELKYTNAGHNPPYLKRVNGEIETLNTLHGPVVGAIEDFVYKENSLIMHANDVLLLFTDGVNEAMNINRELFNNEPIIESLYNFKGQELADDVKGLYNSVKVFEGEAEQADDITILAFEYLEPILKDIIYSKPVSIKNELNEIDRINEIFTALCEQYQIPGIICRKFHIAFDELINNIVSYGYNDKNEHEIKIRINITEKQLQVSIEVDGIAFNPLKSGDPDLNAGIEDREIGGLGIHLIKNLMDDVSYKRYPKKNLTTLFKKIKQ
jgi:sigma-B regulation protein RsbU (phosphoserine phosphatase)